VIAANEIHNVVLNQGILTAGQPRSHAFYVRQDLWMSSMDETQGPYQSCIELPSANIDDFITAHAINVLVMDIEGAERDLLCNAELAGIERIFLELHDHLYGLAGIRDITQALTGKGFAYDPRGSQGPCVLFAKMTARAFIVPTKIGPRPSCGLGLVMRRGNHRQRGAACKPAAERPRRFVRALA
jgi:hypothetical protein